MYIRNVECTPIHLSEYINHTKCVLVTVSIAQYHGSVQEIQLSYDYDHDASLIIKSVRGIYQVDIIVFNTYTFTIDPKLLFILQ
jgi:hypothetical protein